MEGYLSVSGGDPTWSVARDDAQEQKEGHRGERYRLCLCKRLRDAEGDHKLTLNSHNKSQSQSSSKAHYLCNFRPISSHIVNFPLKIVKY